MQGVVFTLTQANSFNPGSVQVASDGIAIQEPSLKAHGIFNVIS